jgi:uncharacterized membrane protein YgaE (UPF0421/DUF939 family)
MNWRGHLMLSVKAALAAGLAWLLVQPLQGFADDYPYYAPLGAVIAVTSTVAGSVRESLQGLAAIAVGAAISLAALRTPLPVAAEIALVVLVGTAASGWQRFGNKAGWVPITALFVLIIGQGDAVDYAFGYLGLVGLGAAVGIGLNVAFPPLWLSPMADSARRLKSLLADQLDDLAEGLLSEEVLTPDEWRRRQRAVRPTTEEMQRVVGHATDARRANWRAKRWDATAEWRYQQARALQQVAFLIEDLTALVIDQEHAERQRVALGPRLRPHAAHALQELAEVLRVVDGDETPDQQLRTADDAVNKLVGELRDERQRSDSDLFAAGTVVAGVRRALASLAPERLRDEIPSDW